MAKDAFLSMTFPIQCLGRNASRKKVLSEPVAVKVWVHQSLGDEKNISLSVECPYNTGGHNDRCKASHPNVDKVGKGVGCPYCVDIPYALDVRKRK